MNAFPQIEIQLLKNLYQPLNIEVSVLRLDKIHPVVSGNKWFKLAEYLKQAREQRKTTILTFGGAYSNHIVATAAACKSEGLQSIGIIRGECPAKLSATLQDAAEYGMELHFISRDEYKKKRIPDGVAQRLEQNTIYTIAEGGYGLPGCIGASSILNEETRRYTHIIAAVGTGTTIAGLVTSAMPYQKIIGIPVLKNHVQLSEEINTLLPSQKQDCFTLIHDYNFGGYAKHTAALLSFMNEWYKKTKTPSDFVYTGKLFYAVNHLAKDKYFPAESNVLIVHSGGLQGNRSLNNGTLIF